MKMRLRNYRMVFVDRCIVVGFVLELKWEFLRNYTKLAMLELRTYIWNSGAHAHCTGLDRDRGREEGNGYATH